MGKPTTINGWGWTEASYDFNDPEQLDEYCKVTGCTKEEALDPSRWRGQSLKTTLIALAPNRKATPKDG